MGLLNFGDDGELTVTVEGAAADDVVYPDEIPSTLVDAWKVAKRAFDAAQEEERHARSALVNTFFKPKSEGSETKMVSDGTKLAVTFSLNRKIDAYELQARQEELREVGIVVDALVKAEPTLILKQYRELTDAQRAVFDQVMKISDGTPQLKPSIPKGK